MMSFMEPLGFAALGALALPLFIHLMRRSDWRVVQFAALRFLRERRHPRRGWHIHRGALLMLRLLLVAGVALLLTSPVWHVGGKSRPPWIVVAPGVDVGAANASVRTPDAEWHWLAQDFPLISAQPEPPGPVQVASLVRQLESDLPAETSLVVMVPSVLGGLDADRLRLGRSVEWRVVPGRSAVEVVPPAPTPAAPLTIAVRYDGAGVAELPVARALAAAWAVGMRVALDFAAVDVPIPAGAWLIWLGGPMPAPAVAWVRRGGTALASRVSPGQGEPVLTDSEGRVVFRESMPGHGRLVSTAEALTTARLPALLEPDIARRLHDALAAPLVAPDRAPAASVAPLARDAKRGATQVLAPWLAACAALLFLIERVWATRPAQRQEPRRRQSA